MCALRSRPMEHTVRRERWRVTHARAVARARAGGDPMSRGRLAVPVFRGGQGRPVEIPIGQPYEPMAWDVTNERVVNLRAFAPKEHRDQYPRHAEMVVDLVLRTDFFSRLRDRHLAGCLHRALVWAKHHGYSTDPASLLSGDRIDAFVNATWTPPATRATHRWNLRHVASVVFPPPAEATIPRRVVLPPHTPDEEQRFLAASDTLIVRHYKDSHVRQALHRDVQAVLALTFGAGCGGKTVHRVARSWLDDQPDGLWVRRPDRNLPSPVLEPWDAILRARLDGNPDEWLVRPQTPTARSEAVGKIFKRARAIEPALVGFDTDRAARCWSLRLMAAAEFPLICASIGSQVKELAIHLPQPDDDDHARTLLRRWAR